MAGEDVNTEQEEISEEVENEEIGQEASVGVKEVVQGGHEVTVEVEELEQRFGVELEEVEQRVGVKVGEAEQRFGTVGEAGQRSRTVEEAGQRSRRTVESKRGGVEVERVVEGVEQRPGVEVEEVVLRARVKVGWTEQSGEVKVGEVGRGTHRPELGFQDVEQGCRARLAGECQREGILVYSTEVSNEQDISKRTSGKLIEKESLTEQNFNLPTEVKRKSRPKIKTQCKRRKLGMSFNPPMIEDRALLRLLVMHSFLDLVCSGQLLIDEYTVQEESTLKSVIGHLDLLDMDRIRPYFTSGGWVIFRSLW
ncbi:hypothetical protein PoB_002797800 [Plakobranchus ocellatus]|uniref:Uncharacterized protein n=1 Tax=Plakobranchus ocellatus TaxID=259542 RepID=A0AAV4A468_9GAST|nr:hypothetical protein PoB_002797800 [Plakobranchus ocellatus]